jgi:hypothetical protein
MGTRARETPARLAEKLVQIREGLELSQDGMVRRMGVTEKDHSGRYFEIRARSVPTVLVVVLEYARAAKVAMEVLVDDGMDLPKSLIGKSKQNRTKRR